MIVPWGRDSVYSPARIVDWHVSVSRPGELRYDTELIDVPGYTHFPCGVCARWYVALLPSASTCANTRTGFARCIVLRRSMSMFVTWTTPWGSRCGYAAAAHACDAENISLTHTFRCACMCRCCGTARGYSALYSRYMMTCQCPSTCTQAAALTKEQLC